ncbi:acetate/propionate family kinase [Baekduia sp. Peel2402]|uniref:acetate/propionate family kinase n=1 Tax=Baekduia sp. Peel2402 TaxID=3458296 RepID=UPI00403EDCB6
MRVLVVNAGSSSLKLSLLDGDSDDATVVDPDELHDVDADAVGHRIVHGGTRFTEAVRIDDGVQRALDELTDLAPLHQPKSLDALRTVQKALPDLPHVACFDTAFHTTLPFEAYTYALPREWRERYGLRRFGFHGLSHAWIARTVEKPRVVSCHLGAGASLCAIRDGRSVDTTMGFTPLEGLVMATRSGSVDPGLVLWLQQHEGLDADTIAHALEHESGLLGLTGTKDFKEILEREDDEAQQAIDTYIHRLVASVSAMAAALGGLDALVFTGGVGEHAPAIRARAAERLAFLGVQIDPTKNAATTSDADVSAPDAAVSTHVIAAREDREIARQVTALLG